MYIQTCYTISVYDWLPQLRWVRYTEEISRDGVSWLVSCHIPLSSQDIGVASCHCSPTGVLETHDDGERDGSPLALMSRSRGNGDAGGDELGMVRRVDWRGDIWRYWFTCFVREGTLGKLGGLRAGILEKK